MQNNFFSLFFFVALVHIPLHYSNRPQCSFHNKKKATKVPPNLTFFLYSNMLPHLVIDYITLLSSVRFVRVGPENITIRCPMIMFEFALG